MNSVDLSKARRLALRKRAALACQVCKKAKSKCNDFRPCTRCKSQGNGCIETKVYKRGSIKPEPAVESGNVDVLADSFVQGVAGVGMAKGVDSDQSMGDSSRCWTTSNAPAHHDQRQSTAFFTYPPQAAWEAFSQMHPPSSNPSIQNSILHFAHPKLPPIVLPFALAGIALPPIRTVIDII